MTDGCADMWAAAIEQALRAGCKPLVENNRNDMGAANSLEAANEWRFLTATHGPWFESRNLICGLCGADPEIPRQEALRRGPSRMALRGLSAEMNHGENDRRRVFGIEPSAAKMERNARVANDYAAGMPTDEMCAKYGLSESRISKISNTLGVRRPSWFVAQAHRDGMAQVRGNKSGSAVDGRGASRAAGGEGVSADCSFHAQSMEEAPR